VRQFAQRSGDGQVLTPQELLQEFATGNIIALEHLRETVDADALERSVDLMVKAKTIYLVGLRRSFPVAAYMAYALRHVDKPAHLIDGMAGMLVEQSSMISRFDLLFAISFRPYAKETADIAGTAKAAGATVVAISDSQLSPVSREAEVSFAVRDSEVRQFRSLTASLCLAQTLIISYAQRVELPEK
jgi:DNA-binding MurR/RpiR family transcriptional regulator